MTRFWFSDSRVYIPSLHSNLHLQCTVGGVDQCGTVDLAQNQQSTHLMSLQRQTKNPLWSNTTTQRQCLQVTDVQFPTKTTRDFFSPALPQDYWTFSSLLAGTVGVPCCRPGAGQCSRSHPAASGQLWPGEGGWLHDKRGIAPSSLSTL